MLIARDANKENSAIGQIFTSLFIISSFQFISSYSLYRQCEGYASSAQKQTKDKNKNKQIKNR